jgi:hypothetical protein
VRGGVTSWRRKEVDIMIDRDKFIEDFERFVNERNEFILDEYYGKFILSEGFSQFCVEHGYLLSEARKVAKSLKLISNAIGVWDNRAKKTVSAYRVDMRGDVDEEVLVKDSIEAIRVAPKINGRFRQWILKDHLIGVCERYGISYVKLLDILRRRGIIGKTLISYLPDKILSVKVYPYEKAYLIVEIVNECSDEEILKVFEEEVKGSEVINGKYVAIDAFKKVAERLEVSIGRVVKVLKSRGIAATRQVIYRCDGKYLYFKRYKDCEKVVVVRLRDDWLEKFAKGEHVSEYCIK